MHHKSLGMSLLQNPIMNYAWGSHSAIAELLRGHGQRSSEPEAELWLGAHPKAPSKVQVDAGWVPLDQLIQEAPDLVLGASLAQRWGRLPFLFKVLAAGQPLSIQAHPDKATAERGFAREQQLGIALDAGHRNYRDDNHKPELLCALTPFWALCGFRPQQDIVDGMARLGLADLPAVTALAEEGYAGFLRSLLIMERSEQQQVVARAAAAMERKSAGENSSWENIAQWVLRLGKSYPDDAGALAPVFLNLLQLQPGQAIFLRAGEMHAYLDGLGLELMANSDNVLRGGLTPKHIDVDELLSVLVLQPRTPELVLPVEQDRQGGLGVYSAPVAEFSLAVLQLVEPFVCAQDHGVEIYLCLEGEARFVEGDAEPVIVGQGAALLIPASVGAYRVEGMARLARASVPVADGEQPGASPG